MHPLSVFPHLLSYPFLAYFILRLVVAGNVFRIGSMRWGKVTSQIHKILALLEFAAGILILIGLYTQPALIAVIILVILDSWFACKEGVMDYRDKIITAMICVIAFALLFLGPGSFALDLPL